MSNALDVNAWVSRFAKAGVTCETLDEVVYNAGAGKASSLANETDDQSEQESLLDQWDGIASSANNDGLHGQIAFLTEHCDWGQGDLQNLLQRYSPASSSSEAAGPSL